MKAKNTYGYNGIDNKSVTQKRELIKITMTAREPKTEIKMNNVENNCFNFSLSCL